ncbi:MAG: protein kinase, partial [Kiritimatiellae bacterium]|nr:protein kinase [Kiritimatiellia bacterium]
MSLGVDEIEGILSAHGRMPTGASFQDGETFGNWRLTAFIGKGGNGEVYRAVHVALGTSAAVKVLFRNEPRVRERFVREAKLLSELKSASFPQFLEYGEANGRAYLVMELLEPGDLPSGDREVARFLRQVCDAVAELHARGIVHRDIKPSNILWRTGTTGVSPVGDTGRTGVPPVGDTGTTGVPPVAVPGL